MRNRLLSVGGLLLAAVPVVASAQSAGANPAGAAPDAKPAAPQAVAPSTDDSLADIVVTAERRTENLQNVPIAATALSGDELDEKGVARISDLQFAAPSLSVTDASLTQSVNIRGIGIASGSPAVSNGVAYYINGVFQPPLLTTSSYYDVGNIEVLRGPQGTLVGSNSTGGAIFVNSQVPSMSGIGGYFQGSYGNYDNRTLQGAVNIPLSDNLAIRGAGNYVKRDSYFTDIGPYHNNAGSLDEKAGRLSLLWTPGNLRVLGHAELIDKETGGYAYQPIAGTPYAVANTGNFRALDYDTRTTNHERGFLADLELRYEFGNGITLRSLTGYVNKRVHNIFDLDATSLDTATLPAQNQDQYVRERETVQEINLISPTSGAFNWILGAYYQRNVIDVNILQKSGAPVDPIHILIHDEKTTVGLFAQAGYKLTDRLELQAGVRYSHYTVDQTGAVAIGYGTVFGPDGMVVADLGSVHKDGRVTGKVGLNFKLDDDNLIYAFAARGYKSGGANSAASQFRPETVWDYEAGWKSTFLNNHLRTQLAAFYMDYHDFQFDYTDTTTGQAGVTNFGRSTIYGVEGQIQAKISGFKVDGAFAYVHSRLGGVTIVDNRLVPPGTQLGPQCGAVPTTGCTDYAPFLRDAGDGPNLLSPKWSYNVGVDYEIKLGDGVSLTPRLNYAYVGTQYLRFFYDPTDTLRPRGLLLAQVTLRYGKWTIEGYGTNLTNKKYVSGTSANNQFYGAPREYGVRLGVKF